MKFVEGRVNLVIELLRRATIKSLSADMLAEEMTEEKNFSKARKQQARTFLKTISTPYSISPSKRRANS